jgi:hypothetical protein
MKVRIFCSQLNDAALREVALLAWGDIGLEMKWK